MRTRLGIVVLVVLAMIAAACGDDDADDTGAGDVSCAVEDLDLHEPGTLTIATGEPVFPPWMIDDDPSNQQGFEGAVAYALAEEMGFAPEDVAWERTDFFEAIAPGPKDYDFNMQQYSISAERDEVVDFSIGYYTVKQALVAYPDSPVVAAETADDLKGYRLGAAIGTTSFNYIEDVIQPDSAAAAYDTNADAKSALDAMQIDALVFDLPTAYYITAVEIPDATIVGVLEAPGGEPEEFGLLMTEGSTLKPCVDRALQALEDAGTLEALEEEWITQAGELKVITP
jgi:polar amino acid transport system substrate-binding protein